jgi:uncharacterized metal-binding protein
MNNKTKLSCSDCFLLNCYRHDKHFPEFCLTEALEPEKIQKAKEQYCGQEADLARIASEVEGTYYGKLTRVEEAVAFAYRINAKKIGIASCIGLIDETRILTKILHTAGFETFTVLCKVGSMDKTEIGVPEELKLKKGVFEASCNPILQAQLLNEEKTDFNIVMGLCIGHDSLFFRHSEAPATMLVVKDRVTGHNPVAALYTAKFYSNRLLDDQYLETLKG